MRFKLLNNIIGINNKKKKISEIINLSNNYNNIIIFDANNISSNEISKLRMKINSEKNCIFLIKKTFLNLFLKKKNFLYFDKINILNKIFILLFNGNNIVNILNTIKIYLFKKYNIKIIYFNNNYFYNSNDLKFLSSLLTYDKALFKIKNILKYISILKFYYLIKKIIEIKKNL